MTLLAVALLFAAATLLIPVHLRSIDNAVIKASGASGRAIETVLNETTRAAHIGPTLRILEAAHVAPTKAQNYQTKVHALIQERPSLLASGGSDRTLEDFLKQIQFKAEQTQRIEPLPLLPQLLARAERASLSGVLASSSNANVAALLAVRNVNGLTRLHPADHAAGAPYDAGILTLALLIEGGHFSPALAQQIGQIATQAKLRTPAAVRALEDLVIATLSIGRQLDHRSLADLAGIVNNLSDWGDIASLFRAQPKRINALYTALRFEAATSPAFNYLATYPDTGNSDLDLALAHGPAATKLLFKEGLPIYQPVWLADEATKRLKEYRPPEVVAFSRNYRSGALAAKAALFLLAGLAFALAMGAAWRGSLREIKAVERSTPSVLARNFFISLVVAITLWILFEPEILKNSEVASDAPPRMEFAVSHTLESLKEPVKAMQELNQVTLLVLALFFIVQLVIYCFCLIKLREIGKQKLSPQLKIKLLENEENLFDFGLYVGLGGTVFALILVAVGIVEASLMAAYASTLFGILFTAMLKILNLRPYRRHLILQAGTHKQAESYKDADPDGALMKNIEL